VTNVTVVDELPKNVTFISAEDGKAIGKYDEKSHTYTWRFDSLEPGATAHLELVVSVNPGLALGTVITNVVSISSNETAEASVSVDAMTYYKPLNITQKAVDKDGNEIIWVDPGDRFIYQINFDNNNNESKVTEVTIVDQLPDELTFVMADDGKATGKYDQKAHTYTWTYGTMNSQMADYVELVVDVNENTPYGIMIINSVTIDSNETLPRTVSLEVPVGEIFLEMENLSITPNVLRRNGTSPNILAVVQFPEGITKNDIEPSDKPKLYYQDRDSDVENFILIGEGSQSISGTENSPRIRILFSRPELMDALYGYGTFTLRVEVKLKTGRTYFGQANVHLTRFAGD
jgi:fimbrial isopeptide formation D2 family protein